MTPLLFVLSVAAISFAAGFLGSLLGLGGGLIVIPALTLLLHVDIRLAIGASIISVIATSSGAAAAFVRDRLANLRVAMFLELGTTTGAITGAYLAGIVHPRGSYFDNASGEVAMELPIKVSTATSNFMIGVTAAASAGVYFSRGQIDPFIAAPVAIGVLAGAFLGSQTLGRIGSRAVRMTFVIVLIVVAAEMLVKGIRG